MRTSPTLNLIFNARALVFILCSFGLSQALSGQTTPQYQFLTSSTASFAADRNGNAVNMASGTTQLIGANEDDNASSVTNIGFTFAFLGTNYTQFSASSNGAIRLGASAIANDDYGNDFPLSGQAIIAPYWGDLETNSSNGKVHYRLVGTAPNRSLVVEFLNMRINYSSTTANGTYQARIYEQSNIIEFVYGAMAVGNASPNTASARTAIIGFSSSSGANNQFSVNQASPYTTSTTATRITNTNSATGTITGLNSSADGSRRSFTFLPPSVKTGTISNSTFCPEAVVSVPFTSTGVFISNTYTAELSTAAGSFTGATSIGSLTSNLNSGTISAVIPAGVAAGTLYRIRVSSNNSSVILFDNGVNLSINTNSTIGLTSAGGTNNQTICSNNPIINITYAVGGGGTGASVTAGALPAGVTGSYNAGTKIFTISGTPTIAGTYNYTVTTTGPCVNNSVNGSITVNSSSAITRSSGPGTETQAVCIDNAITNITYSISGGATGASLTSGSLPAGVTGSYNGTNTFTISGTPVVSGVFNYTVTATGTCPVSLSGSLTVRANSTISLTSAPGTAAQELCASTGLTNITYAIGAGGTGASVTAGVLPSGVTGSYSSGVFTISGTPTETGSFSYTITTTGPCINNSLSGTITVNPASTLVMTSASGTNIQTVCINNAITDISYATGGPATGASVTSGSLPAGVSGLFSAGVFTISGSPTESGVFNYTISTTGSCPVSANGTITVNANSTISQSSGAGTEAQTICINTALTNISYIIGGGTGASVSGLPAGIGGSYNAGVFTISGTATQSGLFNYTVTTSGPCINNSLSGTITVTANGTISLSSGAGTNVQTVCINNAIATIAYTIGGTSTGASITAGGLPAGVSGSFAAGVFTITGTPIASGVYNYTISATGSPCINPSLSGTLTVIANSTLGLTSSSATTGQTVCINTAITGITYLVGGGGTGAGATGLPAGVTGAYNGTNKVFTISGSPTVSGTFSYTVTTTGPCINTSLGGTITVTANATLGLSSGSAVQTVCQNSAITNIAYTIGGSGTGAGATGLPGGVTGSYNAGTKVFTISGTPSGSGTFNYTVTTTGPCVNPSLTGTISVNAQPAGVSVSPATATICIGGTVALTGSGTTTSGGTVLNDNFNGTPTFTGAGTVAGNRSQIFTKETSGTDINSVGTITSPTGGSFMAAIAGASAALGTATSSASTTLTSGVINTTGYSSLNLAYDHTYKQGSVSGSGVLAISTNGGTSYTTLRTFSSNQGGATAFVEDNIVLGAAYLNQTNIRLRFTFTSSNSSFLSANSSWWVIDDVLLNGQLVPFFSWTANTGAGINGLPAGAGTASLANKNITVNPTQTTTYTLRVTDPVTSCGVSTATSTVTVNQNSTIALSSGAGTNVQTVCINNAIQNITYAVGGGGTGAAITAGALPAGVTGSYNAGVFTISGTPTASGVFNYTVTTTGPCVNVSLSGTITVQANSTISLSSAGGTDAQTVCINTGLTNITYAIGGGGTGASITAGALPAGVTGSFSGGVFTISGTPTVSGSFSYTITTAGPCVNNSLGGSIEVTADATISFSSAAGTNGQTVCINTVLTDITYSVGGTATGASVTAGGLPAGVTGSFNAGVFTISGTPAESGVFNYTVSATGSSCINPSLSGTVSVNANSTISLSSGVGTDGQTICINTALPVITYSIGGTGNGASITSGGLPAGVTGSFSNGVFTISGTPTESGHFPYTVSTTGPCVNVSLTGSVTVNEDATIILSSAGGTDAQTVCINNSIINIRYAVGGSGTGASISSGSLPAGVTAAYNISGFTISGTPSESGVFNYTVTTTGPCVNASLSGTITVNANSTVSLSSDAGTDAQTVCINTALTNITYAIGGGGTGGSITAGVLPAGVTGSFNAGVFTISGTPAESGSFSYTVTTTGPCINNSLSGTIDVNEDATIILSSAAGTDGQTVCINTAFTDLSYTAGGSATGVSVTAGGLPAGLSASFGAGVFTISGTPSESGIFNYTITTTGPCVNVSLSGSVTVITPPTVSAVTGPVNACPYTTASGLAATYTVSSSDPLSTYVWALPAGAIGVSGQGSNTISFKYPSGFTSGSVSVTVTGRCGSPELRTIAIGSSIPAIPEIISGPVNVCPQASAGETATYTINAIENANSYRWVVPPTATLVSASADSTSITISFGAGFIAANNKQIRVRSVSGCGNSAQQVYYLVAQLPGTPTPITGPTNICSFIGTAQQATYTIPKVTAASSYVWTTGSGTTVVHPNGDGENDTTILVTFSNSYVSSSVTVRAQNGCGISNARSLSVPRNNPSTPGLMTGPTNACAYILPNGSVATYSISPKAGVTSYIWTAPAGSVVTHLNPPGENDVTITVQFPAGFTSGAISVTAVNGCGSSAPRTLGIGKLNPATPGVIDVIQTVSCPERQYTYTIATMPANATAIQWTVPSGATLLSGQGSTSITVSYPSTAVSGSITAQAINNCGSSVIRQSTVKLPACSTPPPAPFTKNTNEEQVKRTITALSIIPSAAMEVKIFPNPTVSDFKLQVITADQEQIYVRVMDMNGRVLKTTKVMPNQTITTGNELKAGAYLIEVRQGSRVMTQKVLKF